MPRRQFTPEEKSRLVLQAIRGEQTINEIASENNIHPNVLSRWKTEAEKNLCTLFQDNSAKERKARKVHEAELQELYAQIGRLTTQNEWLKRIWSLSCPHMSGDSLWTWAPHTSDIHSGRSARPEPIRSVLQAGAAIRR